MKLVMSVSSFLEKMRVLLVSKLKDFDNLRDFLEAILKLLSSKR